MSEDLIQAVQAVKATMPPTTDKATLDLQDRVAQMEVQGRSDDGDWLRAILHSKITQSAIISILLAVAGMVTHNRASISQNTAVLDRTTNTVDFLEWQAGLKK